MRHTKKKSAAKYIGGCIGGESQRGGYVKAFVNLEAQKSFYPGYHIEKRGIFYGSRMISAQYNTEFTEPDYNGIKKVYSIWICMNPSKKEGNTITRYCMAKEDLVGEVEDRPEAYDLMCVIRICLGDEDIRGS
ncbi:hypothetical protein LQZ18_10905 [Lachnospiraceae bacterium ZAX-1]